MSRINALPHLDASQYSRSVLHAETCTWLEKNCYVDIWIEVVHALGLEPRAILPFTVAIDFEGDQWTFFKPPHDELREPEQDPTRLAGPRMGSYRRGRMATPSLSP